MIRLQTFGGAALFGAEGAPILGAASQRRPLGLLAVLAVAGDRAGAIQYAQLHANVLRGDQRPADGCTLAERHLARGHSATSLHGGGLAAVSRDGAARGGRPGA
jgi:hypothetical protein